MQLPLLNEISLSQNMISDFKGYNHNLYLQGNQFWDQKNMTSSYYPVLSPRHKRGIVKTMTKPNGLLGKETLCYVDGTDFYYDEIQRGTVTDGPKQFISMGAYLLIFPDKKYYDTKNGIFGSLENTVTTSGTVTFSLAKADGTNYSSYTVSDTAPTNVSDGMLWCDTSTIPNVLKQYSGYSSSWVSVPTTYIKIAAPDIGIGFKKYDGVTISGCTNSAFNTDAIVYVADANYLVVVGILTSTFTQTAALTVTRKVPDMEFLTESENRVWGCSSEKHEIYACKLGDPFNWNCFMGISTDSYAVTIGTNGDFTGATTHLGYVLFFKEDVIHKIYGNKPSNYQITNSNVRGVEKGSEGSLVTVNETLFYKSRNDICAYDGGLPVSVSDVFGQEAYKNARAGSFGHKYYISMQDKSDTWHLFVYDATNGIWSREDNTHVLYFTSLDGELYFINAADNSLSTINGTGNTEENTIEWYAETGDIGMDSPDNKYISKLQIRLTVESKSSFCVALQYDSDGIWHNKYSISATGKKSITVPIIPNRCDHMKIRFSGIGNCKVFSVTMITERGSEL